MKQLFELLENNNIPVIYNNYELLPFHCIVRRIPYGSYLTRHPTIQPPTANTIAGIGGDRLIGKWKDPLIEYFHNDDGYLISILDTKWRLYSVEEPYSILSFLTEIEPLCDHIIIKKIKYDLVVPCFEIIEKAWAKFNMTLVDLKIELGYDKDSDKKELFIVDKIDNDCWRIWSEGNPEKHLDEQTIIEYIEKFNED